MLKSKGWGPWRAEWYSICSKHQYGRDDCKLCQAGEWVNVWVNFISQQFHQHCYPLWYWWQNGPRRKANLKSLQRWFPNLK
jgi:hypothetical protein